MELENGKEEAQKLGWATEGMEFMGGVEEVYQHMKRALEEGTYPGNCNMDQSTNRGLLNISYLLSENFATQYNLCAEMYGTYGQSRGTPQKSPDPKFSDVAWEYVDMGYHLAKMQYGASMTMGNYAKRYTDDKYKEQYVLDNLHLSQQAIHMVSYFLRSYMQDELDTMEKGIVREEDFVTDCLHPLGKKFFIMGLIGTDLGREWIEDGAFEVSLNNFQNFDTIQRNFNTEKTPHTKTKGIYAFFDLEYQ